MKNFLLFNCLFLSSLIFTSVFSAEDSNPGLGITNNCDQKYPKEARIVYNQPQYKLAYDRCMKAFNDYNEILGKISERMSIAYASNSVNDFEQVDQLLNDLAKIIEVNGEGLVGWLNRDLLLQDIQFYRKKMQIKINDIKANMVPKAYIDIVNSNNASEGTFSGSTGNTKIESKKPQCRKGYIKNQKTGKCRKVIIGSKKEVAK